MTNTPTYYTIIPARVRYDRNLKDGEKLMYGEILALSEKSGYCFATNRYFSDLFEVSRTTISNWISDLQKLGYIKCELLYGKGTKEVEERRIWVTNRNIVEDSNKVSAFIDSEEFTSIKPEIIVKDEPKIEDTTKNINYIIGYLNKVCGTKYRTSTAGSKKYIKARLREGFSLQDFEKVIEYKYIQWGKHPTKFSNGTLSSVYLRPQTLFGSKFESYLNEANLNLVEVPDEMVIDSERSEERSELEF